MKQHRFSSVDEMSEAAAHLVAERIRDRIETCGQVNIILATGMSQIKMLANLVAADVDWTKVTAFHLDEYIGLGDSHPASFRKYLNERFVGKAHGLRVFHGVNGEAENPDEECRRLGKIIRDLEIDVACVGIGENGHLAFNDPPADFETAEPFIVVELDEACRRQQVGEGWFTAIDDVPERAISMSVTQIMKADCIVCIVSDKRKAEALQKTIEGDVSNMVPASILQRHDQCHIFADTSAASLLSSVNE